VEGACIRKEEELIAIKVRKEDEGVSISVRGGRSSHQAEKGG
jgi:hypothetical protein